MSYPQIIASDEVLQGQEFVRFFSELTSSGDVYEMNESAVAFAIGPQSDIARVRITYWDPILRGNSQSFVVSVGDPFMGRVDAFSTKEYPTVGSPARIIISPEDILENGWRPSDIAGVNAFQPPRIDLIAYLSPPVAVPLKRADFYQKGRIQIGASMFANLIYPYYRRKYASIQITNFTNPAVAYSVKVNGITFTTDANIPIAVASDYRVQTTNVVGPTPVPGAGVTTTVKVKASMTGLFDYLVVEVSGPPISGAPVGDRPLYYTILFTDEEV